MGILGSIDRVVVVDKEREISRFYNIGVWKDGHLKQLEQLLETIKTEKGYCQQDTINACRKVHVSGAPILVFAHNAKIWNDLVVPVELLPFGEPPIRDNGKGVRGEFV